jgi:hypothetical protein
MDRIVELEKLAIAGMSKALLKSLCEIVPNFQPILLNTAPNGQTAQGDDDSKPAEVSNLSFDAASMAAKKSPSRLQ